MAKQVKFEMNYYKNNKIDLECLEKTYNQFVEDDIDVNSNSKENTPTKIKYNPFSIKSLQSYNPIYSNFFTMTDKNYDNIGLNNRYQIRDLYTIYDIEEKKELPLEESIFVKFAPLLDPIRYLIGKYKDNTELLRTLPNLKSDSTTCLDKFSNYNNCSYTDNFFCYLSSKLLNSHGFTNSIDYYGSYLGIQENYKMNFADDIEYLNQSGYFLKNKGILYEIQESENPFANFGSRNNKNKLMIHNDSLCSIVFDDLEVIPDVTDDGMDIIDNEIIEIEETYVKSASKNSSETTNSSNNSEVNYSDTELDSESDDEKEGHEEDDEEDGEEEDEDGEEDEDEDDEEDGEEEEEDGEEDEEEDEEETLFGYIKDFPVQMICLEKCKGTIDELFDNGEIDEETGCSALFQVIMSLLAYQKCFHFTHNDLHTNNIMYIETETEFLYYKYQSTFYKVPTYGKIFKIIDFGRAIYKFKGKTYCSDSFAPGGDAATQYNFEPFFNHNKPRLEPNYAFDLCRLGCSIFDFIMEEEDVNSKGGLDDLDDLQRIILKWVTDDNGRNVLYKRDGQERYPGFKLYKMISRTVHQPTPVAQLREPFFKKFECKKFECYNKKDPLKIHKKQVIDIDELPVYV